MSDQNENFLTAVRIRFYRGVLENEVLAQLVLAALPNESNANCLPDFMAEPWRPIDRETNQPKLGMRFNLSATSQQDVLSVTFSTFHYLEVLTMTTEQSECTLLATNNPHLFFDASDAFMALEVPIDEKREAARQFMMLWQELCQTANMLGARIDPMSATFTTEVHSYCVE